MSVETVQQNMLSNIDDKFDKSKGMWTFDVTKVTAIEVVDLKAENEEITNKLDVENLTGDELKRFVFQRTGLTGRSATYASDYVEIVTTGPTTIEEGDLVAADDLFFEATQSYSFSTAGTHLILVRSQQSGTVGNVPVGAINSFPVTLTNVASVINARAFVNGYEAENDESLRQRYYDKLQRPGKAGNKNHYREWANEITGVGKVRVFPRFGGPLNVRVAILDVTGSLAPQQLIDEVFNHIDTQAPFGANFSVVTGTQKTIDVEATFILKSGYTWEEVEPLLIERLNSYFKSIAFEESINYFSYAQTGREILSVEGIDDYSDLLINGLNTNIPMEDLEVGVIGTVTNV